mgnify:CR=1 FL=1
MAAKLQPYSKYKPISYDYVSKLPDDWQLLPNIAIFDERKEKGTENEETLSISAIRGIVKSSDYENRKDRTSDDKSQYLLVKDGDLAYNTMLMWDGAIGHSSFRGIVSPAYTVLKAKIKINPKYFHYQMRTNFYMNYSKRFSYGIVDARLRLYYVKFKRMYSIVPPLEVQNSIVAYLDKKNSEIDKFIRNKERMIELLLQKKDQIIKKFVTKGINPFTLFKEVKIDWVKSIPQHWEVRPFNMVFSENKIKNDFKEDYSVLSLSYGKIIYKNHDSNFGLVPQNYDSYQIILPDSIVFRFTDLQNDHKSLRVGLARKKGIITSAYLCVRKKSKLNLSIEYAYLLLHSYDIDKVFYQFGGGVRQAIGYIDIRRIPIIIPPLEEQIAIVTEVTNQTYKIDKLILESQKKIVSIKEYREALITDLVTGKRSVPQMQMR